MLYKRNSMTKWKTLKQDLLNDPSVRKEYESLRPYYELAAQIIEARLKRGLSQSELAAKVGTKQSAIARLESGGYNPSVELLQRVARATGTQLEIRFFV